MARPPGAASAAAPVAPGSTRDWPRAPARGGAADCRRQPVFVVLLAVALVAPGFMDWNQYKGQAQQQVKTYTGLDLELAGDIGFTILPSPRFMAEGVTIKAPEGSKSETLVAFERLDVNVDRIPLLIQ